MADTKDQKWALNFLTWSPICSTQSSKFLDEFGNMEIQRFGFCSMALDCQIRPLPTFGT